MIKVEIITNAQEKKDWVKFVKKYEKEIGRLRQNSNLGRQALKEFMNK